MVQQQQQQHQTLRRENSNEDLLSANQLARISGDKHNVHLTLNDIGGEEHRQTPVLTELTPVVHVPEPRPSTPPKPEKPPRPVKVSKTYPLFPAAPVSNEAHICTAICPGLSESIVEPVSDNHCSQTVNLSSTSICTCTHSSICSSTAVFGD